MDSGLTDRQLVSLAQQGDDQAFSNLIDKYKPFINLKIRDFFIKGADRADVMQEGLIGFHNAVQGFREGHISFMGFAELCIRRHVTTAVQMASFQKHEPLNQYCPIEGQDNNETFIYDLDPLSTLLTEEKLKKIRSVMGGFSEIEIKAITYASQGFSYEEAAELMGASKKCVDNAILRARKKLKKALRNY